ncbi:MAG: PilZ domain-containing protein [Phycisphaerae bacterium]|nr:PilZ domain-containing protein [Phycisphaerae bacterium]
MPITVSLEREQAEKVLSAACHRRQPVEIRLAVEEGERRRVSTVLLAADGQGLFVERPVGPDGAVEPAPGTQITLSFNSGGRRYGLETIVRGTKMIQLAQGEGAKADTIECEPAQRVYELQRRAEYRVPLWSTAPIVAHFEPLPVSAKPDVPPAEPFHAELQNISAGGVAALVDPSVRACLAGGQCYLLEFYMPGGEEPFSFAVRVQHIRRLTHNDARLIGLKFLPGDDVESTRRAIQEIREFVDVHRRLKS